jgi:hypothetical protein
MKPKDLFIAEGLKGLAPKPPTEVDVLQYFARNNSVGCCLGALEVVQRKEDSYGEVVCLVVRDNNEGRFYKLQLQSNSYSSEWGVYFLGEVKPKETVVIEYE